MKKIVPINEGDRWRIRVQKNGKRYYFVSYKEGMAGKRECLEKYRAWLEADQEYVTIEVAFGRFLERYKSQHGECEQYIQLEKYGRLYVLPRIGHRYAQELSVDDFQQIILEAKPTRNTASESLSRKTLSNIKNCINQFVKYSVARGYMEPLKDTLYLPYDSKVKGKDIVQPDDISRMFSADQDEYWYINYFRFAVLTGLRPGEVLGLQKGDVNMITRVVQIKRSINARNILTEGKNKNARREFVLSSLAYEVLIKQLERIEHLHCEWLFPNQDGAQANQHAIYKAYKRLGIPGSLYSLRHTFVSMVKNDVPLEMVKAIIGHSASMDTYGTYGHQITGEDQRAAALIDESLRKIVGGK